MKTETPELDKIVEAAEDSQKIGEFLEWLAEQEIVLTEWDDEDDELLEINQTREQLLANYCDIDLVKAEKERQALLDEVRAENERKT